MVLAGLIVLVASIAAGRRLAPPSRAVPAPLLAGLATSSLGAFAVAGLGMMLASAALTGAAFVCTGLLAGTFLWLVRGGEDDGWDDGGPGDEPPQAADWRRFARKRTGARTRTRR